MRPLTGCIADFQFIGFDEGSCRRAVPVGDGLIVLGGLILAAVLELNASVISERHQVSEQKAIGRFNFVLIAFGLLFVSRAGWMSCKRQGHVEAAPIITPPTPFFRSGPLPLRSFAIIKEKTRITFQSS